MQYPPISIHLHLGMPGGDNRSECARMMKTLRYLNHIVNNPKVVQHDDNLITGG